MFGKVEDNGGLRCAIPWCNPCCCVMIGWIKKDFRKCPLKLGFFAQVIFSIFYLDN